MGQHQSVSAGSPIERISVETGLTYHGAIKAFEAAIGRVDIDEARELVDRRASKAEIDAAMSRMAGSIGLMLFATFDQGDVASLEGDPIHCRLCLVGNPAIAAEIVRIDERASLYVPFRVAIYQPRNEDKAVISYDRPSSSLGSLQVDALGAYGTMLDEKMDRVLKSVTAGLS